MESRGRVAAEQSKAGYPNAVCDLLMSVYHHVRELPVKSGVIEEIPARIFIVSSAIAR